MYVHVPLVGLMPGVGVAKESPRSPGTGGTVGKQPTGAEILTEVLWEESAPSTAKSLSVRHLKPSSQSWSLFLTA